MKITSRDTCRVSGSKLIEVFDMGDLPLSYFPLNGEPDQPKYPLILCISEESGLVQLKHTVDPDEMYSQYWYKSGINQSMKDALKDIVDNAVSRQNLKEGDIVADIAANDWTLLSNYSEKYIRVGIDPSDIRPNITLSSNDYYINKYFTKEAYRQKLGDKQASIITSICVFYDLDDPITFAKDIKDILKEDGLWIMEMSYLPTMLAQNGFEAICFPRGTYILGANKNIEDIEVNDQTYGQNGNKVNVKQTFSRSYDGELISIKGKYLDNINVTPEHPILIAKKEHFRFNNGQLRKTINNNYNLEWVNAKDIRKNDYLVVPKIKGDIDTTTLDLSLFANPDKSRRYHGLTSIPLTEDIAWMIGLYVAEGHTSGNKKDGKFQKEYIAFTLHENEENYYNKLINIFQSLGRKTKLYFNAQKTGNKSVSVITTCTTLARALKTWCGDKSRLKQVPDFILNHTNNKIKQAFLKGLFDGDGYIKGNKIHLHSTSKKLILQVQLMCFSLNAPIGISYADAPKTHPMKKDGRIIKTGESWQLRGSSKDLANLFGYQYTGTPNSHYIATEDYILVPIKNIAIQKYTGDVFNFETSDNTYIVSNATVHNCHEHIEYYSLNSIEYILDKADMAVEDIEFNDVNGGSFRVYIRHKGKEKVTQNVINTRIKESTLNLNKIETYADFAARIQSNKEEMIQFLEEQKRLGKLVLGFASSTKGNTIMAYYGIGPDLLPYVADRNPMKYGRETVTRIPIISEKEAQDMRPDYLLAFAYHFMPEFLEREKEFLDRGGRFISPSPKLTIIDG